MNLSKQALLLLLASMVLVSLVARSEIEVRVCAGRFPDTLSASVQGIQYEWNTGDTTSFLIVNDTGQYWVITHLDSITTYIDTFRVVMWYVPVVGIVPDTGLFSDQLGLICITYNNMSGNQYFWKTPISIYNNVYPGSRLSWQSFCELYCSDSLSGDVVILFIGKNQCGTDTADTVLLCLDYCALGLPQLENAKQYNQLSLFPNPTSGTVRLSWNSAGSSNQMVRIMDPQGRTITSEVVKGGLNSHVMDITHLKAGIYLVSVAINSETGRLTAKLVVE